MAKTVKDITTWKAGIGNAIETTDHTDDSLSRIIKNLDGTTKQGVLRLGGTMDGFVPAIQNIDISNTEAGNGLDIMPLDSDMGEKILYDGTLLDQAGHAADWTITPAGSYTGQFQTDGWKVHGLAPGDNSFCSVKLNQSAFEMEDNTWYTLQWEELYYTPSPSIQDSYFLELNPACYDDVDGGFSLPTPHQAGGIGYLAPCRTLIKSKTTSPNII